MNFSSWKHFNDIQDQDERSLIITLLIDIVVNLIRNPDEEKHRILPAEFVEEYFSRSSSALFCLQSIGFQKVFLRFDSIRIFICSFRRCLDEQSICFRSKNNKRNIGENR